MADPLQYDVTTLGYNNSPPCLLPRTKTVVIKDFIKGYIPKDARPPYWYIKKRDELFDFTNQWLAYNHSLGRPLVPLADGQGDESSS